MKFNKFKEIHEYRRDTNTSVLINWSNLDSTYTRRLIQQATMFRKIHYNIVDICPLYLIYNMLTISQSELITP